VNISINYEFGCVIAKLKDSPLAIAELGKLIRHIISRGISFAIRHVESGRIVAAIANIIFVGTNCIFGLNRLYFFSAPKPEYKEENLILRHLRPDQESKHD